MENFHNSVQLNLRVHSYNAKAVLIPIPAWLVDLLAIVDNITQRIESWQINDYNIKGKCKMALKLYLGSTCDCGKWKSQLWKCNCWVKCLCMVNSKNSICVVFEQNFTMIAIVLTCFRSHKSWQIPTMKESKEHKSLFDLRISWSM